MSRAIGAIVGTAVGTAALASNSLYTGMFGSNVQFLTSLFSGGWSQSGQIQPIYWCWRHNLFRRTSLQVGTDNTAPVYNICLEFLG